MSTRSCIARKLTDSTFLGVYHHWDGYPSGLGATLFSLYSGHFNRDLDAMLAFLIDEHPAGWSTINGANFNIPAGYTDKHDDNAPCDLCGLEQWKHYRQYYASHGLPNFFDGYKLGSYQVFDHAFKPVETEDGPQCYCHGQRTEEPQAVNQDDDCGMEWAYVFDVPNRVMQVYERIYDKGEFSGLHMTGMFGSGAPGQQGWALAANIQLGGKEPDWANISAAHFVTS